MTDEVESAAEDTTVPARKRRRWPAIALTAVVLAGVAAGASWLMLGDHRSAEEIALDDFRTARQGLTKAAGAHYTGKLTDRDGKWVALDLRVTNVGEVSGTVEIAPGQWVDYLHVDDKTFMKGTRAAWIADGASEEAATGSDGKQVSRHYVFHGITLSSALNPSVLGKQLDNSASSGSALVVGEPVAIDDHAATPISSGGVTTYVRDGRVSRIVNATFDIRVTPLSTTEVDTLYSDLVPVVTALADASDSEKKIEHNAGWSTPCARTCSALSTITATAQPFIAITGPGVASANTDTIIAYSIGLTFAGVDQDRPDCVGTATIPANGSTTVSCAFEPPPGSDVTSAIWARAIFGQARADQLVKALENNADRSRYKATRS